MKTIFEDLNQKKECSIEVNELSRIHLKIMPKVYPSQSPVSPNDAPLLRKKIDLQSDLDNRLDVVSATVIPHLNGFSPISQIRCNYCKFVI